MKFEVGDLVELAPNSRLVVGERELVGVGIVHKVRVVDIDWNGWEDELVHMCTVFWPRLDAHGDCYSKHLIKLENS